MASDEVHAFQVTVPAGTPKAAPIVVATKFDPRIVDQIKWRVPAGPNGTVGFRISMGGNQVFPRNLGGFIVANGESETWPVKNVPDSGAWDVTAYNTGTKQHIIYVTYYVTVIRRDEPLPVPPDFRHLAFAPIDPVTLLPAEIA